MVLNASVTDPYSGRTAFNGYLLIEGTQDKPNNQTTFRVRLYARNPGGSSQTYALNCFPWTISVGGRNWSGCHSLDFRGGQSSILLADFWTGWFKHDSAGNLAIGMSFSHGPASIFGTAAANDPYIAINRIPKVPGKPPKPTFKSASTTSITFGISAPSDNGGASISTYNLQASRKADFTDIARSWNSGGSTQTASPLDPGTDHWIRYRAVNSVGPGAWSDALKASTLPSVPPGMTITPSLSGTSTSVALTPPQGVSSVTKYLVERRPIGGAAVAYEKATSPIVVQPLAPGSTHEWRASAFIGDYQTPWTEWVTRTQPQPNTNPGDYFDGSTADKPDVDYQWNGTVNSSTSRAVAKAPAGWRSFDDGSASSGGDGVVIRATGGRSGSFGARVTFFTDTTSAGFRAGTALELPGAIAVAEGGVYWGSIYASPSRSQRMAAELIWLNAALAPIGASAIGESVIVPADPDEMVRLSAQGVAPPGAVYGAVGVIDVAGAGWSLWRGGESILLDDAMLSIGTLYDWFSGASEDTAEWAYSWLGAANASVSQATALPPDAVDPLADPDCPPIPSPPSPPAIADDCIEEVGSWRRYWAIITEDQVTEWLDLVPTIAITTGALPARQVRVRVYRNPENLDPEIFPATDWEAEQIVSYIPASTVLTLDGVAQRVWAEVNGGEPISADRLLYGSGGGPASWPVLSCGTAYLLSFDVPLDAPEGNLSVDVALTTRML